MNTTLSAVEPEREEEEEEEEEEELFLSTAMLIKVRTVDLLTYHDAIQQHTLV